MLETSLLKIEDAGSLKSVETSKKVRVVEFETSIMNEKIGFKKI